MLIHKKEIPIAADRTVLIVVTCVLTEASLAVGEIESFELIASMPDISFESICRPAVPNASTICSSTTHPLWDRWRCRGDAESGREEPCDEASGDGLRSWSVFVSR